MHQALLEIDTIPQQYRVIDTRNSHHGKSFVHPRHVPQELLNFYRWFVGYMQADPTCKDKKN